MLRHYVGPSQDDWDLKFPCAEFAINNATKAATGYSPFFLNYGRHPRGPATAVVDTHLPAVKEFVTSMHKAISTARDSLVSAQTRMKRNADAHRIDLTFAVGDQVLLSSRNIKIKTVGTKKLLPKFIGPFTVLKKIGDLAYRLDMSRDMPAVHPVFHVSLLRPFSPGSTVVPPSLPTMVDGEPEYEVERILNHRDRKIPAARPTIKKPSSTVREYLVKWVGYGHESNSWQTHKQCDGSQDLIQEYLASTKRK